MTDQTETAPRFWARVVYVSGDGKYPCRLEIEDQKLDTTTVFGGKKDEMFLALADQINGIGTKPAAVIDLTPAPTPPKGLDFNSAYVGWLVGIITIYLLQAVLK